MSDAEFMAEPEESECSDENWALALVADKVAEAAQQPGRAAVQLSQLSHRLFEAAKSMVIGTAAIRKPSMDLYIPRFVLSMVLLFMVLLLWNEMRGSGTNFAESVTSSVFDSEQVIAVVVTIVMIVLNRAEYTWYTQHRWYKPLDAEAGTCPETPRSSAMSASFYSRRTSEASWAASERRLAPEPVPHATSGGPEADAKPPSLLIPILQKALLLLQLVALHAVYMWNWAQADVNHANPSIDLRVEGNLAHAVFYLVYMAYLSLTSLQLKYDIHVVRGGINLTHNTDIISYIGFNAYSLIPFAEELRVLTDWTATKTSLDFFMWMKLEDAQQNLYRVKRDMQVRAYVTPTHPRDRFEKFSNGVLLIALLVLLIVAPLMYFSTMNPALVQHEFYAAKLSISLDVVNGDTRRTTVIYEARQESVHDGVPDSSSPTRGHVNVTFPAGSDTYCTVPRSFHSGVESLLNEPGTTVNFEFVYELSERVAGVTLTTHPWGSWWASPPISPDQPGGFESDTPVFKQTAKIIQALLHNPSEDFISVSVPNAFHPLLYESSNGEVMVESQLEDIILEFERPGDGQSAVAELPYWSLKVGGSQPVFTVNYEKTTPPIALGSLTVIGIYGTVIYTIGRLLRGFFQDRSKFVLYEELPETQLLLDLCNGIYIARIQGQLPAEYHLYYELLRILRSPELLLEVSHRSRGPQPLSSGPSSRSLATTAKSHSAASVGPEAP
jgi:hypothetical protein